VGSRPYPPLRGTFFRAYPGMHVPNPLVLHAQRRDIPDWNLLLKETLALAKMNWNGTQFDGALYIVLKAARQVGTIPDSRYRFYM
jgi:hypothetical protein